MVVCGTTDDSSEAHQDACTLSSNTCGSSPTPLFLRLGSAFARMAGSGQAAPSSTTHPYPPAPNAAKSGYMSVSKFDLAADPLHLLLVSDSGQHQWLTISF
jgi:hypothetical protein